MKLKKDALYPGEYDGVRIRQAELGHYRQRIEAMLKAGLHIPLAWEDGVRPCTVAEWERQKARQQVLGWTTSAALSSDTVLCEFEVPDVEDLRRLPGKPFIRPVFQENFRDPTGRLWAGPSVVAFSLTPRPSFGNMKPFMLSLNGQSFQLSQGVLDMLPNQNSKLDGALLAECCKLLKELDVDAGGSDGTGNDFLRHLRTALRTHLKVKDTEKEEEDYWIAQAPAMLSLSTFEKEKRREEIHRQIKAGEEMARIVGCGRKPTPRKGA